MGQDLVSEFPEARATFAEADRVLGFPLSRYCFEGPVEVLGDTINTQPALLTHSIAAWRVFRALSPGVTPAFAAGHSMGEFAALVASGALEFPDALRLIRERGRVMKSAGEKMPGLMAAVLGMDDSTLEEICLAAGAQIANYNAPGQIVISGPKEAMEQAIAATKTRGAKRTIPLAVSIAAHSKCMLSGAEEFAQAVARTPVRAPQVPVISNVTARPVNSVEEIRSELVAQLTSSVQWVKSVDYMVGQGVTKFVELGPKDVLAGLIRRINKGVSAISLGDLASFKAFASRDDGGA